jgi:predicted MFS family arabinose efflux permease
VFYVNLPLSLLAMALIARFLHERLQPAHGSLLPLELFGQRIISVGVANRLLVGIVLFGQVSFVPPLLQGVIGASPTQAGLALAATSVGWSLASNLSGRLLIGWGYRYVGLLGSVLLVLGFGLLLLVRPDTNLLVVSVVQAIIGAGVGITSPVTLLSMQNAVAWNQRGVVTSLNQFATNVGGTVGVAVAGAVFSAGLRLDVTDLLAPDRRAVLATAQLEQLRTALAQALEPVYWIFIAASVLALAVMTLLPSGPVASETS